MASSSLSPLELSVLCSVPVVHAVYFVMYNRYASFDYEEGPLRSADLILLDLLVNGKAVDALGRLVPAGAVAVQLLQGQLHS